MAINLLTIFFSLENKNYTSKVINKLIHDDIEYTKKQKMYLTVKNNFMKKVSENVNAINDDIPIEIIIAQNDAKLSGAEAELTRAELTKALNT